MKLDSTPIDGKPFQSVITRCKTLTPNFVVLKFLENVEIGIKVK